MTFDEIVATIQSDLNLTSTASASRIGGWVNRGYRQLCTDPFLGIDTIGEVLGVQVSTVVGNRQLTWSTATTTPSTAVEKILRVYNPSTTPPMPLYEVTVDEIQNSILSGDPAQRWARLAMGASSETVLIDSSPASIYALQADVLSNQVTLSGSAVPAFAEDYHDILVYFGKWQELKKLQQFAAAKEEEIAFHGLPDNNGQFNGGRLSQLRLFTALSMHRKDYQGRNTEQGTIVSARI